MAQVEKKAHASDRNSEQFNTVEMEGVPLPTISEDMWKSICNFEPKPDDIILVTYPKSGTTWVCDIIDMIQNDGDVAKCRLTTSVEKLPFLESKPFHKERSELELVLVLSSPRVVVTHVPVPLLPPTIWEQNCKIIYVARNAKDCLVSYYHFHKMTSLLPDPESWEDFCEAFMSGKLTYGSWYDHVKGWWDTKDKHQILYLFYEDLKKNPRHEICKILKFLGKTLSEDTINKIVHHTASDAMMENPMAKQMIFPPRIINHTVLPFLKKGIPGDWKNHFTVAVNENFDEHYKKEMTGSTLIFPTDI